ncbi:MAG: transposase [Bacillota bacterium]|jgi:transposase|nr:transposase [Bacillota bacterium]
MAIIPQQRLFGWEEIEGLGDLDRLRLVLEHVPDEKLMLKLEFERGRGRDDYPVRAVWNSILAGIVFQHPSIAALRRELNRNGQLRAMCGFKGDTGPPQWVYTRFLKKLFEHKDLIDEIFDTLVKQCYQLLPGFGRKLAMDGKGINSHARRKKEGLSPDGRRDLDADTGVKSYQWQREDGSVWEKIKYWFGYKLHLIVDADYELPVAFTVTPASYSEVKQAHALIDELGATKPEILKVCEHFIADRGYDDGKLIEKLWSKYDIRAVIDIRNLWKDGEKTRLFEGHENIVYDYRGTVYCCCPQELKLREMAYAGVEKKRNTLKYRCPAQHYGIRCKGKQACPVKGSIRVSIAEDPRVIAPLPRSSYRWENLYKKRTSVERVNSRLDVSFGFERHFIRGLRKMELRCSLALCVMLAMAVGRVKEKRPDLMRSLVKSA